MAALTVSCTDSGDPAQGDPDAEGVTNEPVTDAAVGTCLAFRADASENVSELPTISCDLEHTHEIVGVFNAVEDVYPGQEALEETAQRECINRFAEYTGGSVFGSDYFVSWILPTLNGWNDEDQPDREIICVAARIDGGKLTGRLLGTLG